MPDLVFLSYNHQDHQTVTRISSALKQQNVSVFIDQERLALGLPWGPALANALENATAVLVFFGPRGVGGWQEREIYFALDRQVEMKRANRELPVIPVLLPQANPSVVPGFLKQNTWIDWPTNGNESTAIMALIQALRGGLVAVSPRALDICPYRGLGSFRPEDSGYFFGRTELVNALDNKVRGKRVIAVVGTSGSGKSSVVRAGLIPRLRGIRPPHPTWDVAVFTPGGHPWRSLSDALLPMLPASTNAGAVAADLEAGKGALESRVKSVLERTGSADRLMLVIDQMEELFTLAWGATDRFAATQRFVTALLDTAETAPLHLVFVLRADFYSQAIQTSRPLSDAWSSDGQINVGPMTAEELGEAIESPARLVGLQFDRGLVDTIKADVAAQPGSLPLLEYALTNLWLDAHDHNTTRVTLEAYGRLGRIAGSIAKQAEDLYQSFTPEQQRLTRLLMLRLVRAARGGEEGADTRRRATRAEVGDDAWKVAQVFAGPDKRLLVISAAEGAPEGAARVEVAHEALIANWKRLQEWLEDNRDFLLWRQRVANYLETWRARPSADLLLPGELLNEARPYYRAHREELSPEERKYLLASFRRSTRGKILSIVGTAAASIVVAALLAFFLYSRTVDYHIGQITWKGPAVFQQAANNEVQRNYLFALGLAGRPVFPSPNTERHRNWTAWFERTINTWSERFGLTSSILRSEDPVALVTGLAAGGHPNLIDQITIGGSRVGTAPLYAFAAVEARRAGRVEDAKKYLAKGLMHLGTRADLTALIPLAYAYEVMGDVGSRNTLLARIDDAITRTGQLKVMPYDLSLVLPYAFQINRLDAVLALISNGDVAYLRSEAVANAVRRGLIQDEANQPFELLKQIHRSYSPGAAEDLIRRQTAAGKWPDLEKVADLLPEYELSQTLSAALTEYVRRRDVELSLRTVEVRKNRRARFAPGNLGGFLALLEEAGLYDEARDFAHLEEARQDYRLSLHIILLTADLLKRQRFKEAEEFADTFKSFGLDSAHMLAAAWIYLNHPEKASAFNSRTPDWHLPPVERAYLLKIATGQVRDLDTAKNMLQQVGQRKWTIASAMVNRFILDDRIQDAKAVASFAAPGGSSDEFFRHMLSLYPSEISGFGSSDTTLDQLVAIVRVLDRAGNKNDADAVLAGAFNAALGQLSDGGRIAAGLAYAHAKLGRFADARQLADNCPDPKYKLFAYTAILTEYAVRQKPELRTLLDERGFPGTPQFMR